MGELNRLDRVRDYVDRVLDAAGSEELRRNGYVHLYGVSEFAALLALVRGVDAELAAVAGMLHDIHSYKTGEPNEHAYYGSTLAREILAGLGAFTDEELCAICTAICNHSKKRAVDDALSEVIKDADVLSHNMYDPTLPVPAGESGRMSALRLELGGGRNA